MIREWSSDLDRTWWFLTQPGPVSSTVVLLKTLVAFSLYLQMQKNVTVQKCSRTLLGELP